MFVEIVRLFIVLWSTAAGYALGHDSRAFGDSTPVLAPGSSLPPLPCPACGRQQSVLRVCEVLIRDREELERYRPRRHAPPAR